MENWREINSEKIRKKMKIGEREEEEEEIRKGQQL